MADIYNLDVLLRAKSEGMATFKEAENGLLGVAKAGAVVGAVLAGAVVVGAFEAVKAAGAFERQMTQLVTGAGEVQSNIALVSNGLLAMAGQTGVSATELAKGMFMVESAGFHGAEGLKVMLAAAEGAKVGAADLAVTANAVTTVLKDYHMPAIQAADATNFLVSVVSQGKTHMEDLAESLAMILPTASSLGVPLAQVGGAMATLTARGVPAADAATYLRFTLSALAAETPKGADALKSIGLTSLEVGDTLTKKGLLPALELIQAHLSKKFPEGGAAMFATLKEITGGTRGLGAALGLTGQNLADFELATKTVSDQIAAGHGQVIGWNAVQGDFNQKMDEAKFAIEAAGIKLGQILLPYVSDLLVKVTPLIPVIADWADKMLTKLVPALQDLGKAFAAKEFTEGLALFAENFIGGDKGNKIAQIIWDIDAGVKDLFPYVAIVAASWVAWNVALAVTAALDVITLVAGIASGLVFLITQTDLLTVAQWLLNIALDANPIGVVIIAIGLLAAGFVLAYQKIKPFRDFINGLWDDIKRVVQFINDNWSALTGGKGVEAAAKAGGGNRAWLNEPVPAGASGAIVTRPTLALIGEVPEAVVPLSGTPGSSPLGGGGITVNIYGSVMQERDLALTIRETIRRLDREQR